MVDASEVSPYLIVGNQPCVENEDFLSRKKVSFVLNLSNMAVPTILDGIEYKTILLDDEDDEDFLNHLEECLAFMQKAKERCAVTKSRILVYSYFGLSRCCSVCVAHLMKENGWTLRQAWNYLRQCRPAAKPSDGFLLQLMQYEGSLHGKLSMTMQDFYAR
jgi:protein-tyrosine phosphatase